MTAPFPAPDPLAPRHRVAGFDCGEPDIDNYLINHAAHEVELGLSRTWVIARPDNMMWQVLKSFVPRIDWIEGIAMSGNRKGAGNVADFGIKLGMASAAVEAGMDQQCG